MKALWRCLPFMTVLLLGSSSAYAADDIGLSRDGHTWAATLPGGLFDESFRWIPGDSHTESFFVRNQGPSRAFMTIEVRSLDTGELLSNDDITLRARVDDAAWVDLENGDRSESLTQRSIGRTDAVQVDVNATFDPASANRSQTKELALAFSVTLVDALDGDGGGSGVDRLIPDTGAEISAWLAVSACVMLAIGARLARRREEVHHD